MPETSQPSICQQGSKLPQIQTSFIDQLPQRLQRPRPVETVLTEQPTISILPIQEELPPDRRRSRGGLLALFGRGKPTTKPTKTSDSSKERSKTQEGLPGVREPRKSSQTRATLLVQEQHAPPSSSTTSADTLQYRTTKTTLKQKAEKRDPSPGNLASWDPPELFKAYPQAIKHARLRAPVSQVKTILRHHEEMKTLISQQETTQDEPLEHAKTDGAKKKRERDRMFKNPISETLSSDGWVDKVYLLATSGYLLEYAGDGGFDRLPEKVMPLGKKSAAFASDAIPGEHWVLQVSRVANDDGIVSRDSSKSIFKKFGFGTYIVRRTASNYLLIFDRPEDMDSWLVSIRKQIETLGGRKYRPDEKINRNHNELARRLLEKTSQRYLVKRDPHRFADQRLGVRLENPADDGVWEKARVQEPAIITVRRPSTTTQKSIDSPSLSNGTLSSDQAYMDPLKESSRLSDVSAGTKTLSTSTGSSQEPSPARAAFSPEDLIPRPVEEYNESHNIMQVQSEVSLQVFSQMAPKSSTADRKRESSFTTYKPKGFRASSSPALNFSTPSFSKRYSSVTNPILMSSTPILKGDHRKHPPQLINGGKQSKLLNEGLVKATQPATSTNLNIPNLSTLSCSFPEPKETSSLYPNPTRPVHRRFSSLDSTREVGPHRSELAPSSPHPPPTSALPAIPRPCSLPNSAENDHPGVVLRNGIAEETHKVRRPVSLQVYSDHVARTKYQPPKLGVSNPSEMDEYSLSVRLPIIPKPTRAPPPPPLILAKPSRISSHERLPQIVRPPLGESVLKASSRAHTSSFLDLQNRPLHKLQGPWTTTYVREQGHLQDMKVS